MLLAIDVGNSQTKLGLFRGKKLVTTVRYPTSVHDPQKEFLIHVNRLCRKARMRASKLSDAVISSVVPKQSGLITKILKKKFNINALLISGKLNVGITILYKNPAKLGADRICNAVAAFHTFGSPCIVVDVGTATKFEVISSRGEYLGGAIAVGMETSLAALHTRTAQLPNIALRFPKKVIGTSTEECIQSGNYYCAMDAVEGMISRIKKITGKNTSVVATGGLAKLVLHSSKSVHHIVPQLVLEGARIIYERLHSIKYNE